MSDPAQGPQRPTSLDEPTFVLRASDPLAPFLVSIWSSVRAADWEAARVKFDAMIARAGPPFAVDPDVAGAWAALDLAMEMFAWRPDREDG